LLGGVLRWLERRGRFRIREKRFPRVLSECLVTFQFFGKAFGVTLVVLPGDEFILATGEKFDEIVEELAGVGKTAVLFEFQALQIAPEKDPVVDFIEHDTLGLDFGQEGFAEGVER
jgi:hypothetical protein